MESKIFEIETLEKELLKLAKEIDMEDKHVKRFFDGTYSGISLTKKSKEKRVVLLSHLSHKNDGKSNNPIIKSTNEKNHEIIAKMEKFVHLVRLYMSLRKTQAMKEKIKENLAVSFAS